MNFSEILQTIVDSFSLVLIYALVDLFISLKPTVHKYFKSKVVLNTYDYLADQAPKVFQSTALDKNIAISETRDAAIARLADLSDKNGFNVSTDTIKRYILNAENDYKANGGNFLQATTEVGTDTADAVYKQLVAQETEKQAPAPAAQVGGEANGK